MNFIDQISQLRRGRVNGRSLEVSHKFKEFLFDPDKSYPIVHIAGSNGKGSCAVKIARALEIAGYRVGVFTSPHTFHYMERIRVNQEEIPLETVEEIGKDLLDFAEANFLQPTFFEVSTWIAMEYFRRQKVDIAIIEAGMGGRLDSTNAIEKRLLSVISSVSLEHKEVLGNSIEEIATEKAGIIRDNDLILGPTANCDEILTVADMRGATVHLAGSGLYYEIENQNVARKALELLQKCFSIPSNAIEQGLLAKLPGRFELLEPDVLCDAAHNAAGLRALLHLLEMGYPGRNLRFGIALSNHKDHSDFLNILDKSGIPYHWLQVEHERLQRAEKQIGFDKLKELARKKGELLIICGSIYLRGTLKQTALV